MPLINHLKHHRLRLAMAIGFSTGDRSKFDELLEKEFDETEKRIADAAAKPVGEVEVSGGLSGDTINSEVEPDH